MKESINNINAKKARRKTRVSVKVRGTAVRPRMSVRISNKHITVQFIDDAKGVTLLASRDNIVPKNKLRPTVEVARELGKAVAKLAIEKGITQIVFDRGARSYHGRVKVFAEGTREGGLNF